jgi:hypothetical protein
LHWRVTPSPIAVVTSKPRSREGPSRIVLPSPRRRTRSRLSRRMAQCRSRSTTARHRSPGRADPSTGTAVPRTAHPSEAQCPLSIDPPLKRSLLRSTRWSELASVGSRLSLAGRYDGVRQFGPQAELTKLQPLGSGSTNGSSTPEGDVERRGTATRATPQSEVSVHFHPKAGRWRS